MFVRRFATPFSLPFMNPPQELEDITDPQEMNEFLELRTEMAEALRKEAGDIINKRAKRMTTFWNRKYGEQFSLKKGEIVYISPPPAIKHTTSSRRPGPGSLDGPYEVLHQTFNNSGDLRSIFVRRLDTTDTIKAVSRRRIVKGPPNRPKYRSRLQQFPIDDLDELSSPESTESPQLIIDINPPEPVSAQSSSSSNNLSISSQPTITYSTFPPDDIHKILTTTQTHLHATHDQSSLHNTSFDPFSISNSPTFFLQPPESFLNSSPSDSISSLSQNFPTSISNKESKEKEKSLENQKSKKDKDALPTSSGLASHIFYKSIYPSKIHDPQTSSSSSSSSRPHPLQQVPPHQPDAPLRQDAPLLSNPPLQPDPLQFRSRPLQPVLPPHDPSRPSRLQQVRHLQQDAPLLKQPAEQRDPLQGEFQENELIQLLLNKNFPTDGTINKKATNQQGLATQETTQQQSMPETTTQPILDRSLLPNISNQEVLERGLNPENLDNHPPPQTIIQRPQTTVNMPRHSDRIKALRTTSTTSRYGRVIRKPTRIDV